MGRNKRHLDRRLALRMDIQLEAANAEAETLDIVQQARGAIERIGDDNFNIQSLRAARRIV